MGALELFVGAVQVQRQMEGAMKYLYFHGNIFYLVVYNVYLLLLQRVLQWSAISYVHEL